MSTVKNSLNLDKKCLETARRQFCLDVGLPWEEYEKNRENSVLIQKAVYTPGTKDVAGEGARNYGERNSFFRAIICLGQLFICCDERIYGWVVEQYAECKPEWFCNYRRLRKLDEKLKEYDHQIYDTHVYYLPETVREWELGADKSKESRPMETNNVLAGGAKICGDMHKQGSVSEAGNNLICPNSILGEDIQGFIWYEQEEILRFKESNRFTSAISFWEGQPDMLAVAAMRHKCQGAPIGTPNKEQVSDKSSKDFDQSHMCAMAGASRDGEYLWQIGINVDADYAGQGLGHRLVRALKEEILRRGKIPFYGTSESHTLSQTVGLKAGFVPAWTEVSVREIPMM